MPHPSHVVMLSAVEASSAENDPPIRFLERVTSLLERRRRFLAHRNRFFEHARFPFENTNPLLDLALPKFPRDFVPLAGHSSPVTRHFPLIDRVSSLFERAHLLLDRVNLAGKPVQTISRARKSLLEPANRILDSCSGSRVGCISFLRRACHPNIPTFPVGTPSIFEKFAAI